MFNSKIKPKWIQPFGWILTFVSCGNAIYGIVGYWDSSSSMAWKSSPLAVGIYCFLLGVGLTCLIVPELILRHKNTEVKV